MNQFSRPTTKDEEQFGRIEERPQLEDRFRGLLTVSWTRGYSPCHLPISWIGPRTPMAVCSWASSENRCIHEEDSTRLGCRRPGNGGPQTCLPAAHGVAKPAGRTAHLHQRGIQDPREGPSLARRTMQDLLWSGLVRQAHEERRYQGGGNLTRLS